MKTRTLDASGQILDSWDNEHAISHFRQPLHLERSLAIHIGSLIFNKIFTKTIVQEACPLYDLNLVYNVLQFARLIFLIDFSFSAKPKS